MSKTSALETSFREFYTDKLKSKENNILIKIQLFRNVVDNLIGSNQKIHKNIRVSYHRGRKASVKPIRDIEDRNYGGIDIKVPKVNIALLIELFGFFVNELFNDDLDFDKRYILRDNSFGSLLDGIFEKVLTDESVYVSTYPDYYSLDIIEEYVQTYRKQHGFDFVRPKTHQDLVSLFKFFIHTLMIPVTPSEAQRSVKNLNSILAIEIGNKKYKNVLKKIFGEEYFIKADINLDRIHNEMVNAIGEEDPVVRIEFHPVTNEKKYFDEISFLTLYDVDISQVSSLMSLGEGFVPDIKYKGKWIVKSYFVYDLLKIFD